jgi:two-component system cell cycle response regulator DivK
LIAHPREKTNENNKLRKHGHTEFPESVMTAVTEAASITRRPKVLLVEDNYANRNMLMRRLQRRGYDVLVAADGPSGVAMTSETIPDIVLMDVALGEMNGWQATRRIKAEPNTAHIPVIALTAHALATDREMSIAVGCSDFDTKPVDLARLIGKISACLSASRCPDTSRASR